MEVDGFHCKGKGESKSKFKGQGHELVEIGRFCLIFFWTWTFFQRQKQGQNEAERQFQEHSNSAKDRGKLGKCQNKIADRQQHRTCCEFKTLVQRMEVSRQDGSARDENLTPTRYRTFSLVW